MIPWSPEGLATVISARLSPEVDLDASLTGAVIDSRQAGPGTVFVALPGERADGADFVDDAVRRGSPLAITSRPVSGPYALVADPAAALRQMAEVSLQRIRLVNRYLRVIAVTGSVGKTTTKDLLARIAGAAGQTVAAPGSFNNQLGVPLTVVQAGPETAYLVLEMGASHRGEIADLARIAPPDVGVVLNVSLAHLGEFGSTEAIGQAKAELVAGLARYGVAVLNQDDRRVAAMVFDTPGEVVTFGFDSTADIYGFDLATDGPGYVSLSAADQRHLTETRVQTRLVGKHLGIDVLAALAGAVAAGLDLRHAGAALRDVRPASPHRMAVWCLPNGSTLVDDSYNASPWSMREAIGTAGRLARQAGRPAVAVIGSMLELGARSERAHRTVALWLARDGFERLIAVGEETRPLAEEAVNQGLKASQVEHLADTSGLAELLATLPGEPYVLLKGSNAVGLWQVADELTAGLETVANEPVDLGSAGVSPQIWDVDKILAEPESAAQLAEPVYGPTLDPLTPADQPNQPSRPSRPDQLDEFDQFDQLDQPDPLDATDQFDQSDPLGPSDALDQPDPPDSQGGP
ncbi:MAG: UDP-N-acetylmuramoyl-tripeptide--D-alanyl-D-alanine ligase [Bifidobacteriaceae bacterium]|jgi:UDP-N-acetylmuramoyl-tripeptide--D-alanyl-D-alanine ligase|nr:UDP-N-acetylmuramoyl-tripeptide--D-alanyl-D-alanine ligase [Bifidobacteriaceae bacterium]